MTDTPEGFEAMGKPVPTERREAAYQALKEMAPDSSSSERWSRPNDYYRRQSDR